jgi:hypothetical protein
MAKIQRQTHALRIFVLVNLFAVWLSEITTQGGEYYYIGSLEE